MSLPIDIYTNILTALDMISQGKPVTVACDKAGISYTTLRKYCRETPELQEMFDDAEQRGFDYMADSLVHQDRLDDIAGSDVKAQKLMSDNIKWFLSRKRPQQYGERVVVENHFTADKAIIDALNRGRQRASQIAPQVLENVAYEVIDAVVEDDTDISDLI